LSSLSIVGRPNAALAVKPKLAAAADQPVWARAGASEHGWFATRCLYNKVRYFRGFYVLVVGGAYVYNVRYQGSDHVVLDTKSWVKVIYGFHGLHGLHGLVDNL
jgi:hypothetical protein